MDLRLHFRVLWRFRVLVLSGFALAFALTFLSFFSVDFKHGFKLGYRQSETWQSSSILLVTQKNSPLYSTNPLTRADPTASAQSWLTGLPSLYAQLANSDVIAGPIRQDHSLTGSYTASQVLDTSGNGAIALPFLEFDALSTTQAGAVKLATTATSNFLTYLRDKQVQHSIPVSQRVVMQVITPATPALARVVVPRKKTVPVIVFLAVMAATIGLAYIRENLTPKVKPVPSVGSVEDYLAHAAQARTSGLTRREA